MSLKDIAQGKTKKALGSGSSDTSDSPVVKPEVGEELVGTFEGASEYTSKFNADKMVSYYRFTAPDGTKFTLRSHGDLADSMGEAEKGMLLSIERGPDKKTKAGYNFAQYFVNELVDEDSF